jgi:hypothetical protein
MMYSSTHSLTSALDGSEWSASRPGHFTPKERAPGTDWMGGWVGPRAVLDAMVKKIPSPPPGNRTLEPRSSSPQPSAIPTELSRLLLQYVYRYKSADFSRSAGYRFINTDLTDHLINRQFSISELLQHVKVSVASWTLWAEHIKANDQCDESVSYFLHTW